MINNTVVFQLYLHEVRLNDGPDIAYAKAKSLIQGGCTFSEFGTRRRRSFDTQDTILCALRDASKDLLGPGKLSGTSNVRTMRKVSTSWYFIALL